MVEGYKMEVEIEGSATYEDGILTIKGEKGETSKNLFNPAVKIKLEGNKVILSTKSQTKNEKKLFFTFVSHVNNLIQGPKEGYVYKLKVCSSHFPMTVAFNNNVFEVKNFIGEKTPRKLNVSDKIKVNINGDEIVVEGINKEDVGQTAASIENLTKRRGFDKRIFQDGIYITEKDGRKI